MDTNGIGLGRKIRTFKGDGQQQAGSSGQRAYKPSTLDAVKITRSDNTARSEKVDYNPNESSYSAIAKKEIEPPTISPPALSTDATENSRMSEKEAQQLAEKIGRTLKVSATAFGKSAALFNNLDGAKVRDLLR
jgi:hypothetical protein